MHQSNLADAMNWTVSRECLLHPHLEYLDLHTSPIQVVKQYYPSGLLSSQAHYRDGQLHGPYLSWYESGPKEYILNFHFGHPDGVCRHYTEDGVCTIEVEYQDGVEHGKFYTAYEDGVIRANGWFYRGNDTYFNEYSPEGDKIA